MDQSQVIFKVFFVMSKFISLKQFINLFLFFKSTI